MVEITKTKLDGVVIIEPKVFSDDRGFFMETFRESWLDISFLQDNHSKSSQGVLRGLHFQTNKPQGKLVRAIDGSILDVAVDINSNSETYKQWVSVELSSDNKKQFYIPPGYAHGFLVLSKTAEIIYKCTEYYNPESEKCLLWNDKEVGIDWGLINFPPMISEKDKLGLSLSSL